MEETIIKKITAAMVAFLWLAPSCCWGQWSGSKELHEALLRMQDMETAPVPLKAEVTVEFSGPQEQFTAHGVMLRQPGARGRWYLEFEDGQIRAIVDDLEHSSFWLPRGEKAAKRGDLTLELGRTDLIVADLGRFVPGDFQEPRIVDENLDEIQVGMYMAPGMPYVYRVYTIDKKRSVPVKIQYFAGQLNNLAKVRLDSGHVKIYDKWLPSVIVFKNFVDASETRLALRWSAAESLDAGSFDPASLTGPSPLRSTPAPNAMQK